MKKIKQQPTRPRLLQAQQAPALPYAKVVGRPGTGSYPAPSPDPTIHFLSLYLLVKIRSLKAQYAIYTQQQKKPDTFCFPLTRKYKFYRLMKILILLPGHHNVFSKKICLPGMKYDVRTSKMMFLSNMSLKHMSKIIV